MIDKDNINQISKQLQQAENDIAKQEILIIRTINDCMIEASKLPKLKKLFGQMFHTGEVAVLAGDTGLGKSLLAVQIANAITKGKTSCLQQMIETSDRVLYFDIELSDRQFYQRYENYYFDEKLFRVTFNPNCIEDGVLTPAEIERAVSITNANIIILDNITALALKPTKEGDVAMEIMRTLKKLASQGKSILVLAHTPKLLEGISLTNDKVMGSKYLSIFADSVFFLGKSFKDKTQRYIKHTKARNDEMLNEVIVIQVLNENSFLGFEFVEYDEEYNHLISSYQEKSKEVDVKLVLRFHQQGMSYREIASQLGVSKSTIGRVIKEESSKGQLSLVPTNNNEPSGTSETIGTN